MSKYEGAFPQKYCTEPVCKILDKCATILVIMELEPHSRASVVAVWWHFKPLHWKTTSARGQRFQDSQVGLWDV